MAVIYTDSQVDALAQERKPLPANWKDRARMKAKRGHDEQHLDLTGDAGTGFRLIFRQSKLNRHRCSGFAATTAEATNTPTNISNALSMFRIQDRDGELVLDVPDSRYGDALYSFVQALLRISDVSYLSRERVKSTVMEDFRTLLSEALPEERMSFGWNDPTHDPNGIHEVDCRVNGMPRPLFVHALGSDGRTRDATIALLQFEKWGLSVRCLRDSPTYARSSFPA